MPTFRQKPDGIAIALTSSAYQFVTLFIPLATGYHSHVDTRAGWSLEQLYRFLDATPQHRLPSAKLMHGQNFTTNRKLRLLGWTSRSNRLDEQLARLLFKRDIELAGWKLPADIGDVSRREVHRLRVARKNHEDLAAVP